MLQRTNNMHAISCNYTIDPKRRFDSSLDQAYLVIVQRNTIACKYFRKSARNPGTGVNSMKALQMQTRTALFAGVLDTIAESFGRPPANGGGRIGRVTGGSSKVGMPNIVALTAKIHGPGRLARAGNWLWRRQKDGVDAHVARANDMFAALDRWLWKQHQREAEMWLAQSKDVFELEARIRQLERGPARLSY